MPRQSSQLILSLALLFNLAASGTLLAAGAVDDAIKRYYAGYPDEAIDMLRPGASAGDAEAQYLLGNILYTLANSGQATAQDDPVTWYRLAAAQDSAPANYALGAIHNNRWLQSHLEADANLAQSYFERAQQLGLQKATSALAKLQASRHTESLSYTNESFGSKRQAPAAARAPLPAAKPAPQSSTLAEALRNFQSSGDTVTDAENLQRLISGSNPGGPAATASPDLSTLQQLLGNFESVEHLFSDLLQLYEHIENAGELSTEPGAN